MTETAILNPTTINETRFQYSWSRFEQDGSNEIPGLEVSGAFNSGSSQVGESFNERRSWELNNFTAKQMGTHAIKFGGRIRHVNIDDTNEGNFGGTWTFTGGFGLTSIERYQLTLRLLDQGLTPLKYVPPVAAQRRFVSTPAILSPVSVKRITACSFRMIGASGRT